MADINIHGYEVQYDDLSTTVNGGVKYLKEKIDASEAKVYFDDARKSSTLKAHFEDQKGNNFTLVYNSGGTYTLRKRAS